MGAFRLPRLGLLHHRRAGYLGPESGRLSTLVDERGPEDPEYQRRLRRIFFVSRIELLLLVLAVLDMTIKPNLS